MAFSDLGSIGATGSSGNNQASLALTTTATCAVGELVVVVVAVDNPSNGGDSGVSGVQNSGTANTWTKAIQIQNALAAQGGASCSIWYTVVTTQITSGATITATFSNATTSDASGLTARHFSKSGTVSVEGTPGTLVNNTGADPGSLNVTTANIACLRVRGIASQVGNNTNLTPTASWTAWANGNSATTGTTAEMCARAEHIISTATGAASDPTYVSAIYASAYVAFKDIVSTADAWNANDASANITLSASDKVATAASATLAGVRATTTRTNGTAGKYYAEFVAGSTVAVCFGIQPISSSLVDTTVSIRVDSNNGNMVVSANSTGVSLGAVAASDVICVAWDTGAELAWLRKNNGNWNNDASANPATGTNGVDASSLPSTAHTLWIVTDTSGSSATVRTELAEFTQSMPVGFSSWMGETIPASLLFSPLPMMQLLVR